MDQRKVVQITVEPFWKLFLKLWSCETATKNSIYRKFDSWENIICNSKTNKKFDILEKYQQETAKLENDQKSFFKFGRLAF